MKTNEPMGVTKANRIHRALQASNCASEVGDFVDEMIAFLQGLHDSNGDMTQKRIDWLAEIVKKVA